MKKIDWEKVVLGFEERATLTGFDKVRATKIKPHSKMKPLPPPGLIIRLPAVVFSSMNEAVNHPGTEIVYNGNVVKAAEEVSL